ncbi:hypothetical protein HUK80_06580 [Flavobacterium sp. MAH-1]|uniref:Uncharacterized protein n=1 Tax=Flavobacterium agri TaxID=2743471 RepID=A0A7Y9C6N6_9FLAO|nr:hypothetical protein [Flavobacterium agri]NUY80554.1 hypothetical protein [Flavobacterium agri]NYA70578.1 hypothetical protein [Flavobacterium agri]
MMLLFFRFLSLSLFRESCAFTFCFTCRWGFLLLRRKRNKKAERRTKSTNRKFLFYFRLASCAKNPSKKVCCMSLTEVLPDFSFVEIKRSSKEILSKNTNRSFGDAFSKAQRWKMPISASESQRHERAGGHLTPRWFGKSEKLFERSEFFSLPNRVAVRSPSRSRQRHFCFFCCQTKESLTGKRNLPASEACAETKKPKF